jgi:phthiodiolone/phenolphthiodiolone dimycocerosates ketoreductase
VTILVNVNEATKTSIDAADFRTLEHHCPTTYLSTGVQGATLSMVRSAHRGVVALPKIAIGLASPTGPDPSLYRGVLRLGRAIGLDSLLFWDHLQDFTPRAVWRTPGFSWMADDQASPHSQTDPFTLLAYLSRTAGRVRLGVGVTDTIRRHPATIAQSAVTLATMTKRPPILGIGAGERMNTKPYGISFDRPVSRFEEAVQVLRACIDAPGPINFAGAFYTLENAPFDLTAPGSKPEIWIAAQGPRMLRIAGRYADGWLPSFGASPSLYEDRFRRLQQAARDAGRDPAVITPSLQLGMVLAPTRERAAAALRSRHIRFHAVATTSADPWRAVGHEHPFGSSYRGFVDLIPEDLDIERLETAMATVPDEVLESAFLWGTVDDIVASIRDLGDAGLRHVSLMPSSYPISKKLANYSMRALPLIVRRLRK